MQFVVVKAETDGDDFPSQVALEVRQNWQRAAFADEYRLASERGLNGLCRRAHAPAVRRLDERLGVVFIKNRKSDRGRAMPAQMCFHESHNSARRFVRHEP